MLLKHVCSLVWHLSLYSRKFVGYLFQVDDNFFFSVCRVSVYIRTEQNPVSMDSIAWFPFWTGLVFLIGIIALTSCKFIHVFSLRFLIWNACWTFCRWFRSSCLVACMSNLLGCEDINIIKGENPTCFIFWTLRIQSIRFNSDFSYEMLVDNTNKTSLLNVCGSLMVLRRGRQSMLWWLKWVWFAMHLV